MIDESLEQLVVELADNVQHRYFGKYRGIVEEVPDDDEFGRIVAKVPSVYGDAPSPRAWPAVPFAGQDHGFVMLPEVGDGVWIEFEAGDPAKPIWTGCWWAKGEMPDPAGPTRRSLITPSSLKVVLDDEDKKIQLLHPDGAAITMTSNDITIQIGTTKIVLSSSGLDVNDGAFRVGT
jgi:uncharacterized protein involved in type VI secretion and phage assembly